MESDRKWRQQIRVSDALLLIASSALYVAENEAGLRFWHMPFVLFGLCIQMLDISKSGFM